MKKPIEIDTHGLRVKIQTEWPQRTMTISLPDKHTPHFDIKGTWAGADIRVIMRSLARAYSLYKRTQRRELGMEDTSDEGQQPISARGALNG